ncbi:hypothetical protein [Pseudomonas chlororaphis]|uniref:hypothetical protein n=1 Tax=Pseudomonas chlororaphis TaxID=587753 RepID=UPI001B32EA6C|nr:hypothetical protein [Pseudomonas chlororaphis]MBP5059138.1 hypothetical protein [Pseudomonas chlororaphis]MBP5144094.1 hypothetical protein [Pseudomonas chlororaphis]
MAFLAAALPYIAAAGTVISTVSTMNAQKQAGQAQNASSQFAADQYEDQANAARATAQRRAIESRRQGRIAGSRAQAVGAATGGAGSVDLVNRIADLEGQGEYAALVDMYNGEETARGMQTQSNVLKFSGGQAESAGNKAATGTLISGAANLAAKYGSGLASTSAPSSNMQGRASPLYSNPAYVRNM